MFGMRGSETLMSHMLLVRKSDLPKIPEPIARYFTDWGRSYTLFGIELMRVDTKLRFHFEDWSRKRRGIGPGHSVECRSYSVGPTDFHEWIRKHQDVVVEVFGLSEDHNEGVDSDD